MQAIRRRSPIACSVDEALATQAFDYVFRAVPQSLGDPFVRRLDIRHMAFLSEQLGFPLDDLSCYVFFYLLKCGGDVPLTVLEYEFVKGLVGLNLQIFDGLPCNENNFRPLFDAVRLAVLRHNTILRDTAVQEHPKLLSDFYNFLYGFVLAHYDDEAERRQMAVELWKMFFYIDEEGGAPSEAKGPSALFLHYRQFKNLDAWCHFVLSPVFTETSYDEEEDYVRGGYYVSRDLWQQLFFFATMDSYEEYDLEGSWPSAVDDFVSAYT